MNRTADADETHLDDDKYNANKQEGHCFGWTELGNEQICRSCFCLLMFLVSALVFGCRQRAVLWCNAHGC